MLLLEGKLHDPMLELALDEFPVRTKLNDESPCSIRLMEPGDETAFRDFHAVIPEREQLFIRNQIKDGTLFREWMADTESGEHLPLLAFVDGHLAAMGYLHQRPGGWKRHIGEVIFLTHPDYRGLGLIDRLLEEIIRMARHCGLTKLESELNGERVSAIEAMASAGFTETLRIPEHVQDMQAQYHDYVLMGMNLLPPFEDLGVGD